MCEQGCFPDDDVPASDVAKRSLNEEKAFADGSSLDLDNCYINDGVASSEERWGWTIGPLSKGSYSFPMYAKVQGCDASTGIQVGVLDFTYGENGATATFTASDGIALLESQFYVGATKYPKKAGLDSVSPGQFTSKHARFLADSSEDTFNFSHFSKNSNGEIYIIARTVVSGEDTKQVMDRNGCVCVCPTSAPTTSSPTSFPTEAPSAFPTEIPSSTPTAYPTTDTKISSKSFPTTSKVEIPESIPVCVGYVASWAGDPHMKTFDGLKYDCQGEGEFHVVRSLDSDFQLQGRFIKFNDKRRPTVTNSVAFDTGDGEPVIQITVPKSNDNGCTPYVYVGGSTVPVDIAVDGVGDPTVLVESIKSGKREGYKIYYSKSKVELTVMSKTSRKNGCVLSAKLCLPFDSEKSKENLVGLLGTPNGDQSDDWMKHNKNGGGNLPVPSSRKELRSEKAYDFCVQNWCITDEDKSLFSYAGGESFAGFSGCAQGSDSETEKCVNDPVSVLGSGPGNEVIRICGTNKEANDACYIDGCVGGPEAAKEWVEAKEDLVASMCGKQIFHEDFDTMMDGAWVRCYYVLTHFP